MPVQNMPDYTCSQVPVLSHELGFSEGVAEERWLTLTQYAAPNHGKCYWPWETPSASGDAVHHG